MGTGCFPGVKRPGRGADHPPPSKCRGQERVGLYLYSPSGISWPVLGARLRYFKINFGFTIVMNTRPVRIYAICSHWLVISASNSAGNLHIKQCHSQTSLYRVLINLGCHRDMSRFAEGTYGAASLIVILKGTRLKYLSQARSLNINC